MLQSEYRTGAGHFAAHSGPKESIFMNVLLINGSPHEKGCTYTALSLIAGELNASGIETEILNVGKSEAERS